MENEFPNENLTEVALELKRIIKHLFGVNIDVNTRKRAFVDARRVYSKILRDIGFSYASIGFTLKKDHATIIHYLRNIDHIFVQDKLLFDKYKKCRDVVFKCVDEGSIFMDESNYKKVYVELEQKVNELQSKYAKLHQRVEQYKRIESIIDLVNERTIEGMEEVIENKIRTMFNGLKKE
jgi:hypothetical protein